MGASTIIEHQLYVERLWRALRDRGLEAFLELVPEDSVWELLAGDGRVMRGREELRAYYCDGPEPRNLDDAVAYGFEQIGECVLVTGSLRRHSDRGFRDAQVAWVYFFDDGTLVRSTGYPTTAAAREAIAAHAAGRRSDPSRNGG